MPTYTRADLERIASGGTSAEPAQRRSYTKADLEAIAGRAETSSSKESVRPRYKGMPRGEELRAKTAKADLALAQERYGKESRLSGEVLPAAANLAMAIPKVIGAAVPISALTYGKTPDELVAEGKAPALEGIKQYGKAVGSKLSQVTAEGLADLLRLNAAVMPEGEGRQKVIKSADRVQAGEVITFDPRLKDKGVSGDTLMSAISHTPPEQIPGVMRVIGQIAAEDPGNAAVIAKGAAVAAGKLGKMALQSELGKFLGEDIKRVLASERGAARIPGGKPLREGDEVFIKTPGELGESKASVQSVHGDQVNVKLSDSGEIHTLDRQDIRLIGISRKPAKLSFEKELQKKLGGQEGQLLIPGGDIAATVAKKAEPALKKAPGAVGYRPSLPPETRQFMGEVQSRSIAESAKMRTTLEDAAKGLTKAEKNWLADNFYDTYRTGAAAPANLPGAQRYLDSWRSVSEPIPGAYKAAGREIGQIENYVPQVWTDKFRNSIARQRGDLYEAWLDDVKALNPELTDEAIGDIADKISKEVRRGSSRGESYTKGRFFKNMPSEVTVGGEKVDILEKNPFKLASSYSENVGRNLTKQRVANEQGFGSFSELESQMRGALRKQYGEATSGIFTEQMKLIHGEPHVGEVESLYKAVKPVSDIVKGLKLTTTSLPNAVQGYVPLLAKAGPKQFAKTVGRMLSGKAKDQIEFGRRAGSWTERYLEEMAGGITGEGVSATLSRAPVKWTGGEMANRGINKVASVLADDMLKSGDELLVRRIGQTANFDEVRIQKILGGVIDDADRAQAMQYLAAKTNNALELATETSRFYTNPVVRDSLLFTGITRTLGNATLDAIQAARGGDVRQLAYLLGFGVPAAYGTQEIRAWLNKRDRYSKMDNGERLFEVLLQTGLLGMLGYHAESVKRAYQAKGPGDIAEKLWTQYMPPAMDAVAIPVEMLRRGNAKPLRVGIPIADVIAVQFGATPLGQKEPKFPKSRTEILMEKHRRKK